MLPAFFRFQRAIAQSHSTRAATTTTTTTAAAAAAAAASALFGAHPSASRRYPVFRPMRARGIVSEVVPGTEQHVEVTDSVHTNEDVLDMANLRKRLLLNSKYRGRVETELILGGFASLRVQEMSEKELREFEYILAEQDIDLFNWLMGKEPMPEELQKLSVMQQIQAYMAEKQGKTRESQKTWKEDYDSNDF